MTQKASMESMSHTLDNPSFVSDLPNIVPSSQASINNQSVYLKPTERKTFLKIISSLYKKLKE